MDGGTGLRLQIVDALDQAAGVCPARATQATVGPDGVVWVATDRGGVTRIAPGPAGAPASVSCLGADALDGKPVTALLVDPARADTLWLGLGRDGGLVRLAGGVAVVLRERDGLFCDSVHALVADGADHLWTGCGGGVGRVALPGLREATPGRGAVRAVGYDTRDGMMIREILPGPPATGALGPGGLPWLLTGRGATVFGHGDRPAAQRPRIDAVEIDGAPHSPTSPIEVTVDRAHVAIRFAAFALPGRVFSHRLEGEDGASRAGWSPPTGETVALYRDLPPGRYRFSVKVASGRGADAGAVTALDLRLRPVFYRRPSFQGAAAALLLALALVGHRLRLRAQRARFAAITAERSRMARELHDSLGQGFAAASFHVEAIRQKVARAREDGAPDPGLDKLLAGLDHVLSRAHHDTRRLVWDLRAEPSRPGLAHELGEILGELRPAGQGPRVELEVDDFPDDLPAYVEHEALQLCREAVTNAIRHAEARTVRVRLVGPAPGARIVIQDDGRGFDPARRADADHFGLLGMQERARRLGVALTIDAATGRGTTITLDLKEALHG
jgi:signal transduction histidine kinase